MHISEKLNDKSVAKYVSSNEKKISWSRSLKQRAARKEKTLYEAKDIMKVMYRPYTKKWLYRNKFLNENVRKTFQTIPDADSSNLFINVSGPSNKSRFSVLISDVVNDLMLITNSRNFPRYIYEKEGLFTGRMDNIKDGEEFYFVYGILHSEDYRDKYANDLQKTLPRIPEVKEKEKYVEIGRKLADLHLNYEDVPAYDGVNIVFKSDNPSFKVKKMKHPKRGQLDTIIFNEDIVITDIPERAYEYVVNGKPAIEWIIDQYQVKKDKKSGIVDDPNEFSDNPKYIFNLLLSIINVSMQTMDLVESLPPLEIID
ncbi:Predicted helicase [Enterococcus hirae]|nr:Predicted helicase [Enterococcus hirae]